LASTARKLLTTFGSVKRVAAASEVALAEVVGPSLASTVHGYFRTKEGKAEPDAPAVPEQAPAGPPPAEGVP
jgi:ERCC4-type nuclease